MTVYRYRKPTDNHYKGQWPHKGKTRISDIEAALNFDGITMEEFHDEEKVSLIVADELNSAENWGETIKLYLYI